MKKPRASELINFLKNTANCRLFIFFRLSGVTVKSILFLTMHIQTTTNMAWRLNRYFLKGSPLLPGDQDLSSRITFRPLSGDFSLSEFLLKLSWYAGLMQPSETCSLYSPGSPLKVAVFTLRTFAADIFVGSLCLCLLIYHNQMVVYYCRRA